MYLHVQTCLLIITKNYCNYEKICFLVDSIFSIGGVQRVTAVIAKELAKTYEVTIITLDSPKQKDKSLYELNNANIKYRFFSYPKVGKWKKICCKALVEYI